MSKAFIVWNSGRTEAVVFLSEDDAKTAADGKPRDFWNGFPSTSTLADAFYQSYGEHEHCSVEPIDIQLTP